jgi:ABC-2 type transport system ATP-binding protein
VGGHDMLEDPIPAKRLIGYLPEDAPAYTDMTVHGFLSFSAELRGLRRREEEGRRPRSKCVS